MLAAEISAVRTSLMLLQDANDPRSGSNCSPHLMLA